LDFGNVTVLLISGTASIGPNGETLYVGDFRAQTRRMLLNVTHLLAAEGASWKDVVRTTYYLRDIDRDYAAFNEERTAFYEQQHLDPLPASTGIQAKLCRPDLLVEMEAIVVFLNSQNGE
jgi:2-iminobutanoate/2-iminopropanoate deaminase